MSKYKVGDELIIVTDPNQETKKLKDLSFLKKDGDFACLSWGIKIVDVLYEKPNVTLTYKNVMGFKCYKECPMNEKITGEECVFSMYLDKSFLLEDDYEKSNLVLSQVN